MQVVWSVNVTAASNQARQCVGTSTLRISHSCEHAASGIAFSICAMRRRNKSEGEP